MISVLTLGGTISMTGDSGVSPTLGVDQLLAAVPQLIGGPKVTGRSLIQIPGANITFDHLDMVAAAVRSELAAGSRGVVIVQGTDTIEETSFGLDLLLSDVDAPVVVTGAMRNPTLAGHDGPANIFAAVHAADSESMQGLGVTVVMNDTVHAACRVQKRHASKTNAFESTPHGALGWFQEGKPVIVDTSRAVFRIPTGERRDVRVPLIPVTLDTDLATWEAVIESRINGLVVAGFGVGHVPEKLAELLIETATRIPVVLATRTAGGSVHTATYGFAGSEQHLLEGGLISAGWLDPIKARILTSFVLRNGSQDVGPAFLPARP